MKLLTVLIVICALVGIKKKTPCFDKSNSAFFKAMLPFFIILHHVVRIPEFQSLGTYVVALFFFMSGYGLEYKRNDTSIYSTKEIVCRITKLTTPIVVPIVLYILLRWSTEGVSFKFIADSLKSYEVILPYSWFVLTLLQLYLMFYIVNNLCHKSAITKRFPLVIFAVVTTYIAILFVCKVQSTYYCSVYGFVAGIFFKNIEPCVEHIKRLILVGVVLLLLSQLIIELHPPMTMFYNSWLYTIACALIFSALSLRNMVVDFFSKISYEIYLCQGIGIYSLKCIGITNETLGGVILIVFISVTLAFACHYLTDILFHRNLISIIKKKICK